MIRFINIFFIVVLFNTSVFAVCDTAMKKKENEEQKALKILGLSGSKFDEKTGKYIKYNFNKCEWELIEE